MKDFLMARGIELFGAIPLSSCKITKKYLLDKAGLGEDATVVMMLIPYRSSLVPQNLSAYASVPDYHRFTDNLRKELLSFLRGRFGDVRAELFADHSPIDEVNGACLAGLGFIGDNGLLINEKYSSFVFLCELITSLSPSELGIDFVRDVSIKHCLGCGACARACPSGCIGENGKPKSECLSAITQKKGTLTDEEIRLMLENGSVWGCDICQNACPYTKNASLTPIEYFKQGVITHLSSELIEGMSDEEFLSRPFSWRGREIILRNTRIFEEKADD